MKQLPMSYSSINRYHTCPYQFYRMSVIKDVKDDGNKEHLIWGNAVHKAFELYVKDGTPLPANMTQFQKWADVIDRMRGEKHAELSLAIDHGLNPTGFWDDDVWLRGKIDLVIDKTDRCVIWDHKTGKVKPDMLQLKISALLVFSNYPDIRRIHTAFIYLAHDEDVDKVYTSEDIPTLVDTIRAKEKDYKWSYENDSWPCKPSGLCHGWCAVESCQHWREKR